MRDKVNYTQNVAVGKDDCDGRISVWRSIEQRGN